jgi:hypothetical protein
MEESNKVVRQKKSTPDPQPIPPMTRGEAVAYELIRRSKARYGE